MPKPIVQKKKSAISEKGFAEVIGISRYIAPCELAAVHGGQGRDDRFFNLKANNATAHHKLGNQSGLDDRYADQTIAREAVFNLEGPKRGACIK